MINLPLCNRWRNRRHLFRLEERQLASQLYVLYNCACVEISIIGTLQVYSTCKLARYFLLQKAYFVLIYLASQLAIYISFLFTELEKVKLEWLGGQLAMPVCVSPNTHFESQLARYLHFPKLILASQLARQVFPQTKTQRTFWIKY